MGVGASRIALTFDSDGWSPCASMTCPKYSTDGTENLHLDFFKVRQSSSSRCSTKCKLYRWLDLSLPVTRCHQCKHSCDVSHSADFPLSAGIERG